MAIMLTKQGFEKINNELNKLIHVDRPQACQFLADNRPIGVVEDNPEYMQAIDNQDRIEKRILDLTQILSNCTLFEKNMCKPNIVSFGATVEFINCETDEVKVYTIVSIYESDISKGLISNQAPFAKSMMGCTVGDDFYFNDDEYIINNITYSLLED